MIMRTGQWAFVLCAVLSGSCDDRHLGFGTESPNTRGVTEERDAGPSQPAPPDAGASHEVATGVDASSEPPADNGGHAPGGDPSDALPASCAELPAGIFPPGGVTCVLVDLKAGQSFCLDGRAGDDGPLYMDFVGCQHGAPATQGASCSNGMCCYWLETVGYPGAPGDICGWNPSGMQMIAYGKALDTDLDFIPDYRDNCPAVFNPFGQNDDDDGDGIGNACDPCPEVPGVACADAGAH